MTVGQSAGAVPRCGRCQGSLIRSRDLDGPAWKCLACGKEEPMAEWGAAPALGTRAAERANGAGKGAAAEAPTVPPTHEHLSLSVEDAIRRELCDLLRSIAGAEELKLRAGRLRAALVALGEGETAPALPWVRAKAMVERRCIRCGRVFHSVGAFTRTPDGIVCRLPQHCRPDAPAGVDAAGP